jgi:predicted ABC-class ATPase
MVQKVFSLVVDASVARAAGSINSAALVGQKCRHTLQEIANSSHKVFFSSAIRDEWNLHQSNFSRTWRANMIARRRVVLKEPNSLALLRNLVESSSVDERIKQGINKDLHLIEAAIFADKRLITLDEKLKDHMQLAVATSFEFRQLIWFLPLRLTFPIAW